MPSSSSLIDDTVTNTEYINKKKSTQINVYQEKKYAAYLDILKYFTIYCVILLVLAILRKRMILSYGFVNLLTMLLVIGGGIHLYLKLANINNRNNMNFDEYDWSFNPDNQSDPNRLDTNLHEETTSDGSTCIGELCCDTNVTKWCEPTGLCILKDSVCVGLTTEERCGLKTGNNHASCIFNNNHHEDRPVSPFISGIADSFSYFKKSMNNIPQKEEKSKIGSYSDPYSSYASV